MTDDLLRTTFTGLAQRTGLIRMPNSTPSGPRWSRRPRDKRGAAQGELVWLDHEIGDGNTFNNVKLAKGRASLWMEEFRGEVTATMVYDGQAVHAHFSNAPSAAPGR